LTLDTASQKYGLVINTEKTKIMTTQNFSDNIIQYRKIQQKVDTFTHLLSLIAKEA